MFIIHKKQLEQRAIELAQESQAIISSINKNKFTTFSSFVVSYEKVLANMLEASEIEEKVKQFKNISGSFKSEYIKYKNDFQWYMKDALDEEYKSIIKDSKGKFRNNIQRTLNRCWSFKKSIDQYCDRFDGETAAFANELLRKLSIQFDVALFEGEANNNTRNLSGSTCYDFDSMDGHDFEYWCANLLRKNDFENVQVTQGSGDQGVDITAEKDGIRYAIQCKCYSSDLGNSPIQEVCAGKHLYHCQIGVVMTNRFFTKSAQELARATGTLLWGRDRIIKMLSSSTK